MPVYNWYTVTLHSEMYCPAIQIWGRHYRLLWSGIILEARQVFLFYFNDKASWEEHKTINSGLRISGMALSNQIDLPAFLVPGKSNSA
jgi:hypothetical protein